MARDLSRLVASLLVTWFACACSGEGAQDALERVQQTGVLRWGADIQGGEPYVFEGPNGELAGFELEIANALARELGVRAEMVQNDWSTLVPSLERGTFDVVLNGLEDTPARRRRLGLTRPYYVFAERLVARSDDARVRDLASLRGRRVGTLANSQAWDMLAAAGAVRVPYEGVEEPYLDLVQGRTDAVLLDDVIASRYGKKPGLRAVGDVSQGHYVLGVRREHESLRRALDAALERIGRTGELRAILAHFELDGPRQATIGAEAKAGRAQHTGLAASTRPGFVLGAHQLGLFLQAAVNTLLISSAAMALAVAFGLMLAVARLPSTRRGRRALGWAATAYVELFRGTPVLLQLYVLYYGLAGVVSLNAFAAAVIGLGLNYAAYEAEIYRAGIQAVPRGEIEAAHALGMSGALTLRRVILPQAVRFSLPGIANDFIALLKDSSLVSVITVVELTKRMTIAAVNGRSWFLPGALCALMYFAMSYPLSRLAQRLEQRLGGAR